MDWTRSAIGSALGAGAPGWDPGAVVAAPVPPTPTRSPPSPVGLAKQLAGALRPISKSKVAGSRGEGAKRLGGGVCVLGGGHVLSCRSLRSRWSARAGGAGWG